jgi:three-Cys-motif partner protein
MEDQPETSQSGSEERQHLKRVSRIKHIVLQKYLPTWAKILGSRNNQLAYVDCFAGPGEYEYEGSLVGGSPVIAAAHAVKFAKDRPGQNLLVYLIEGDPKQLERLEASLKHLQPYPDNLKVDVRCNDCKSFVPSLLQNLNSPIPSFFLIDPYGHPLSIPIINKILGRQRSEVLINLMWFQINRDLANPKVESSLIELFGDRDWQNQPFMGMRGVARENAFLEYFKSRLECEFILPFKIRHDPEDSRGGGRTKYYLLHASNHVKAVLLMKDVMWKLGDEEGTFDYSGTFQEVLISQTPTNEALRDILCRQFSGKELSFDEIVQKTWNLPFTEKYYNAALKAAEGKEVTISRIDSKRHGIKGRDRIRFKQMSGVTNV